MCNRLLCWVLTQHSMGNQTSGVTRTNHLHYSDLVTVQQPHPVRCVGVTYSDVWTECWMFVCGCLCADVWWCVLLSCCSAPTFLSCACSLLICVGVSSHFKPVSWGENGVFQEKCADGGQVCVMTTSHKGTKILTWALKRGRIIWKCGWYISACKHTFSGFF